MLRQVLLPRLHACNAAASKGMKRTGGAATRSSRSSSSSSSSSNFSQAAKNQLLLASSCSSSRALALTQHHRLAVLRALSSKAAGSAAAPAAAAPTAAGGIIDLKAGVAYTELIVGVPRETYPGECRVAGTPETVGKLVAQGMTVHVEKGAGDRAGFTNAAYVKAGGVIVEKGAVWKAHVITKVRPPSVEEAQSLGDRALISMIQPAQNPELLDVFKKNGATVLGLDQLPRTLSRGQAFDVLSSQANIAGYKAVLEAVGAFQRFVPGQITAAGRVQPAKVLVLGAGVAGLSAVQHAKNLGAIVRAFDVRPVVKEQVESLGGEFVEVAHQEDGSGAGGYAKVREGGREGGREGVREKKGACVSNFSFSNLF